MLKAVGSSDDEAFQTIRLGLGRSTQQPEIVAEVLIDGIRQLKS